MLQFKVHRCTYSGVALPAIGASGQHDIHLALPPLDSGGVGKVKHGSGAVPPVDCLAVV